MNFTTLLRAWREIRRKQDRCLDIFLGPVFFYGFIPLLLHGNSGSFSTSSSEHVVLLASIEEGSGAVQRFKVVLLCTTTVLLMMLLCCCMRRMRRWRMEVFNLGFGASHNLISNRNRHNNVFINGLIHTMMQARMSVAELLPSPCSMIGKNI